LFREELVMPEEIKFQSARTMPEVVYSPTKVKSKYLMKPERMKVIENLHAYQSEMRA
jgi:hypothetical protein